MTFASETRAERAARQLRPLTAAIAADPVRVKDRLFWLVVGCWAVGFGMGVVMLALIWAVIA